MVWVRSGEELDDELVGACGELRALLAIAGRQAARRLADMPSEGFRVLATRRGAQTVKGAAQWMRNEAGVWYQPPALIWTACEWGQHYAGVGLTA